MSSRFPSRLLLVLWSLLAIVAATASANEKSVRPVEVSLAWAPSPTVDEQGRPLAPAVRYEVFATRDDGREYRFAVVAGDTSCRATFRVGVTYRLRVVGYDQAGRASPPSEWSDPILFAPDGPRSVASSPQELPPNRPNPFNPTTWIAYRVPSDLPAAAPVPLTVVDLRGRHVRTFAVDRTAGLHEVRWDGTDETGAAVATGIYVTRFVCGDRLVTRKMTLLK